MPGPIKKPSRLQAQMAALDAATTDPSSEAALSAIRTALREGPSLVAARAAKVLRAHALEGFAEDLEAAFRRFLSNPVKSDPGCAAKLAVVEALDFGGHDGAELFLLATRCVQMEPAWGPPVDTAVGVRSRGILALARVECPELSLAAGALLADAQSPVRQAAAEAIASTGDARFAGLLVLRWNLGDEDPLVVMACMGGLLALAPAYAFPRLRQGLERADEMAAMALGQSTRPEALDLLLEHLASTEASSARAVILRAVGLHRSERAIETLLQVIASGSPRDAAAALAGLGARRFEAGVREKARRAAGQNRDADLETALAEAFPPE
jgi:HEAT repeat protein